VCKFVLRNTIRCCYFLQEEDELVDVLDLCSKSLGSLITFLLVVFFFDAESLLGVVIGVVFFLSSF